ncbi:hypothetical protein [Streptomyces sp. NBC_00102]|uniref:hypothetical protein n=1 Tax=Streptomyces sp. NBC_00102 TaxID=2975652 RepID=UPI00224E93B3|nr:hypothetical protein [Streptomyces sp. NBC_00102]MCX5397675.1 hypothetical protein [Streptomyces sp. NBC_00102]
MTQSGQGDDQQLPAVRPAHEGVVLPADGGAPWNPAAADGRSQGSAPAGGPPWDGQAWGSQAPQQHPGNQAQGQPSPYQQQGGYPQSGGYGVHDPYQQAQQTQYLPASGGYQDGQPNGYQQPPQGQPMPPSQPQPYAQPLPPEAVPGRAPGGDSDATQFIAPVPAGQDNDATQYIPPTPGAPYDIRPGAPEDRRPPAEFDNLFRSDEPAGATTQMPRVDPAHQQPGAQQQYGYPQAQPQGQQQGYPGGGQLPPQAPQQGYNPGYQSPQAPYESAQAAYEPGPEPRRRSAHIPLIAAVVVGCAVIGLGAGALLSGGDDPKDDKQPVASASSPAADSSGQASEDLAKPQAEELDKLLADSNSSRTAVINAVEKIKACKDLDQAAADLTGAAQQRRGLVDRLKDVQVDKLPDNAALTAALTQGWEASASADEHYAAWAKQAKGKKVCKGNKPAAGTNETSRAGEKSGEATTAKKKASRLWNAIAQKYGLTTRTYTEL